MVVVLKIKLVLEEQIKEVSLQMIMSQKMNSFMKNFSFAYLDSKDCLMEILFQKDLAKNEGTDYVQESSIYQIAVKLLKVTIKSKPLVVAKSK